MKTKTLLIAAATLAAGVISSQAQVYSQNIVGYVNEAAPANFTLQTVPFDIAGGNSLTNILTNPGGAFDGSSVLVWNGTSYTQYTLDSSFASGVGDAADAHQVTPPPTLPVGTAYLFSNQGPATTNTYVGSVHIDSGSIPGTTTNIIPGSQVLTLLSPKIPVGGGVSTVLGLTNNAGALDGNFIIIPVFSGGVQTGFNQFTFDSGFSTGFGNAADSAQAPEPQIPVGGGFFYGSQDGNNVTWIQHL
jgi:hypothetical protein